MVLMLLLLFYSLCFSDKDKQKKLIFKCFIFIYLYGEKYIIKKVNPLELSSSSSFCPNPTLEIEQCASDLTAVFAVTTRGILWSLIEGLYNVNAEAPLSLCYIMTVNDTHIDLLTRDLHLRSFFPPKSYLVSNCELVWILLFLFSWYYFKRWCCYFLYLLNQVFNQHLAAATYSLTVSTRCALPCGN